MNARTSWASPACPDLLARIAAFAVVLPVTAGCGAPAGRADSTSHPAAAAPSTAAAGSSPEGAAGAASPRVVSWGGAADLERFYPAEAERRGVEGLVEIAVTLDPQGRATYSRVVSETPPGLEFGRAALDAAQTMVYANPTGRSAVLTFNVKFALARKRVRRHGHGPRA
jgi:periplasmic protein TonB